MRYSNEIGGEASLLSWARDLLQAIMRLLRLSSKYGQLLSEHRSSRSQLSLFSLIQNLDGLYLDLKRPYGNFHFPLQIVLKICIIAKVIPDSKLKAQTAPQVTQIFPKKRSVRFLVRRSYECNIFRSRILFTSLSRSTTHVPIFNPFLSSMDSQNIFLKPIYLFQNLYNSLYIFYSSQPKWFFSAILFNKFCSWFPPSLHSKSLIKNSCWLFFWLQHINLYLSFSERESQAQGVHSTRMPGVLPSQSFNYLPFRFTVLSLLKTASLTNLFSLRLSLFFSFFIIWNTSSFRTKLFLVVWFFPNLPIYRSIRPSFFARHYSTSPAPHYSR